MTGVCGWLGSSGPVDHAEARIRLEAMSETMGGRDLPWSGQVDNGAGVAFRSRSQTADLCRSGDLLAAIDGHPRWADNALAALAHTKGNAAALAEAYARNGPALLAGLTGEFSIAVLDVVRNRAFLAVDRLGRGRMHYTRPSLHTLIFGSTADAVAAHPDAPSALSEQAIYEYLFFYFSPAPLSIYHDHHKLMAGQYLVCDGDGIRTNFYWRMPYDEPTEASAAELAEALRQGLRRSMRQAIAGRNPAGIGAFLSGGLDSSTMSGLLNELQPGPARCFTIGFDEPGYDEMAFATNVATHFGVDHIPYYMTNNDLVDAIPRIVAAYDEPFGNSSAVPTYICARLARENGIDLMIAGDGGDELFAGNERYVTYDIYERYNRLPGLLRRGLVEPSVRGLSAITDNAVLRKGRNFLRTANTPMPDRLYRFNAFSRTSLVETYGSVDSVFDPDFAAAIDLDAPVEDLREIYDRTGTTDLVQRMMHGDLQRTLADNDLHKVGLMCELAGVEVEYPFLDDEVVSFSAGIPTRVLLRGGELRGFYKDTFRDFLPIETIEKSKHGFGLPTVEWMRATKPMEDMVRDAVGSFSKRGIIRASFCADIVDNLMNDGSPYLANSTWDIMFLELWLQNRGFQP